MSILQNENALEQCLQSLNPEYLQIENESANHAGYYPGKASHFKVTIVSDAFVGKSRVARHQMVYHCAHDLLTAGGGDIHALAIHAYTSDQWPAYADSVPRSPQCAGRRKDS